MGNEWRIITIMCEVGLRRTNMGIYAESQSILLFFCHESDDEDSDMFAASWPVITGAGCLAIASVRMPERRLREGWIMANIEKLRENPLWKQASLVFRAMHEAMVCAEEMVGSDYTSLMRQIPRCVAEGVMAETVEDQYAGYADALSLTRKADLLLHEMASEAYSKSRRPQTDPIYEKLINAFILADQLREMIFNTMQIEDNIRNIA